MISPQTAENTLGLDSSQSVITYSPAYTLVPTYECFNRCTYCNFRADPGTSPWITMAEAEQELQPLTEQGVVEILILGGEVHPLSPMRKSWFTHIYDLCQLALDRGFLPHTNVGPLSREEMSQLSQVNVSMGLMLEQLTPRLLQTVHRDAPSKKPTLRLQQLHWAGELKIPFTTGLLLGIGETMADREMTLTAIADCHQQWGHIQEVILQPHRIGSRQRELGEQFTSHEWVDVVTLARNILPADVIIQIPPNLSCHPQLLLDCLTAGARDLGGIGSWDRVNPDYPHPTVGQLHQILMEHGWQLYPRLPVYPQYIQWLPQPLLMNVMKMKESGLPLSVSGTTPHGDSKK
jgi:7,8-didemethyl-8-hydroxy-5-deazariboflavin synthase